MSETFFDAVKNAIANGSWSRRGKSPKVKRFSRDSWMSMTEFGVLIQDSLKLPKLSINGSVIYEDNRGQVYLADTKQSNLDLAEKDLKDIFKENFCHQIYLWVYDNPNENTYGFRTEIKIID
jgi:hypothetical protein